MARGAASATPGGLERPWRAIEDTFRSGLRSRHELPVGRRDVYGLLARLHRKRLLAVARRPKKRVQRDAEFVAEVYETEYASSTAEFVRSRADRHDLFLVNRRPVYVDGWFTFEYRAELLERALAIAEARTALEVGSGRGILLALLALRRPDLELQGIELVADGVARSYELAAAPATELLRLCGIEALTPEHEEALARLRFHQGDATQLPFEDRAFDVSFTCLALEQMPSAAPSVVREMARVTSGYCVFLEPFADANGPLGTAQLRALDYFHGSFDSFRELGLEPVYFTKAFPQKIRFKTGLLVARVAP